MGPCLGSREDRRLRSPSEDPCFRQGRVSKHGLGQRRGGEPGLVIWLAQTSSCGQALQREAWAEGPDGSGPLRRLPGAVGLSPKAGQQGGPRARIGARLHPLGHGAGHRGSSEQRAGADNCGAGCKHPAVLVVTPASREVTRALCCTQRDRKCPNASCLAGGPASRAARRR